MSNKQQFRLISTPLPTSLETCLEMFMLHQEAAGHTSQTRYYYQYTLKAFIQFLNEKGVTTPDGIESHHVRTFIVAKQRQGCKDTTVWGYASSVRAFLNFLVTEGVLEDSAMRKVTMPKMGQKIHPPFSRDDIEASQSLCTRPTRAGW